MLLCVAKRCFSPPHGCGKQRRLKNIHLGRAVYYKISVLPDSKADLSLNFLLSIWNFFQRAYALLQTLPLVEAVLGLGIALWYKTRVPRRRAGLTAAHKFSFSSSSYRGLQTTRWRAMKVAFSPPPSALPRLQCFPAQKQSQSL